MPDLPRWYDKLRGRKETKAPSEDSGVSINAPLTNINNNLPRKLQLDFASITKWAYRGNELVHACIAERTRALKEAPLRVFQVDDDKWVPNHEVELLMKHPNPFRSEGDFLELVEQHLSLAGNCFIRKVRNRGGQVAQLWIMQPHLVSIVPDPIKFISHYIYTVDGTEYNIPVEDVIHLMYVDPENDYYGLAPIVASARRIDADTELGKFMKQILLNMAVTTGVFSTDKKLNKEERTILEDTIQQKYVGSVRAGLPMLLGGGMKWEKTSMDMKELEVGNIQSILETRICMSLHVPAILVGAKAGLDRSTFSNAKEAREYMYENAIHPEWTMIAEKIGDNLLLDFGSTDTNIIARFDTTKVRALQDTENEKWERVKTVDFLSDIEKRLYLGYGPEPDGAVYKDMNRYPVYDLNEPPEAPPVTAAVTIEKEEESGGPPKAEDSGKKKVIPRAETIGEGKSKKKSTIEAKDIPQIPTPAQRQEMLEAIESLETINLPLLRAAGKAAFEDIVTVINKHLDAEGIKTKTEMTKIDGFILVKADTVDLSPVHHAIAEIIRRHFETHVAELVAGGAEAAKKALGSSYPLSPEKTIKFSREYTKKLAQSVADTSVESIQRTIKEGFEAGEGLAQTRNRLNLKMNDWSLKRAEMVARTETIRASNAGALELIKTQGVAYKEWVIAPDACSYCANLAGLVVPVNEDIMGTGDALAVPDSTGMKNDYLDVGTPPIHPNCKCTLVGMPDSAVEEHEFTFTELDDPENASKDIRDWIEGSIGGVGKESDAFKVAYGEGVQNALRHGDGAVGVTVRRVGERVDVTIRDGGAGFIPKKEQWLMPPAIDEAGEIMEHGRGLASMSELSDQVTVQKMAEGGNRLRLTKKLKKAIGQD
ncbi:MAG: phage portal protein [Planctomycetota bacterium]